VLHHQLLILDLLERHMWKLLLHVILEALVGVMVGGVILALVIPQLLRRHWMEQGDVLGAAVVALVLLITIGAMVLRPGSALHRIGRS
jgi:hypothetical protein